jgi:glyoxylase-like metal-dependent hydrolase (beta-lactamase superfamily II)
MKLTDTIYAIPLIGNRAYLIAEQQLVLIDTGMPFQAKRIIRFIKEIGRDPKELAYIILTHHHIDHRGSACALKALTGAKLAAHKHDIPFIEGNRPAYRDHPRWWVKLLLFITDLLFQDNTVAVDRMLVDADTIQGLKVIHTPGHTAGSISLLHKKTKALFCGDTAPYTLGKLKKPNPYSIDRAQEIASIKKLAAVDCAFLLPNDCKMVLDHPQDILKEFCARKASREKP